MRGLLQLGTEGWPGLGGLVFDVFLGLQRAPNVKKLRGRWSNLWCDVKSGEVVERQPVAMPEL